MADQQKPDRNRNNPGSRRDELGTERNRDMITDEESRARRQREGNLGNERNRSGEDIGNRRDEGDRRRDRDADRMTE